MSERSDSPKRPRGGLSDARAPENTERPRGGLSDARAPENTERPRGVMSDASAPKSSASGEPWRELADEVAEHARDFLDALAALARGEGADEVVPLLLLEVAQVMLAGAQLGASRDVIPPGNAEPDIGADPDLDELRVGLAERLAACDEYAELFDPYRDSKPTAFRLSDDLSAVAADLIHGMRHYEAGRPAEALWWWQYSYVNQWGTHGGAALRALHAVVAHARLDVAEEEIPT